MFPNLISQNFNEKFVLFTSKSPVSPQLKSAPFKTQTA